MRRSGRHSRETIARARRDFTASEDDNVLVQGVARAKGGLGYFGLYQPLSRPIFIYVSAKSAERPEVREFVEYYLKNAPALVKEVKYVPLADADYARGLANFTNGKTGTGFGGASEVGIAIADLPQRDPKE